MLIFIKLGGSFITDKRQNQHFNPDSVAQAAHEIAETWRAMPSGTGLLIGHGSGSFGHVAAKKHGTAHGVNGPDQWQGFAEVARVARQLNTLMVEALTAAGLPIMALQPSSSARCEGGRLFYMDAEAARMALKNGLVPLVYGDVAFDAVQGGAIISTEAIFSYLAEQLLPDRILLLGDMVGVYDSEKKIVPEITPANFDQLSGALGGSTATDVTGGMFAKVQSMLALSQRVNGLHVSILGGEPGQIAAAMCGQPHQGTVIRADMAAPAPLKDPVDTTTTARRFEARSARELKALQTVSQVMATSISLGELLRLIVDKLTETIGAEKGTLYLIDSAKNELYSEILQDKGVTEIRVKIGEGLAGTVAQTGTTINLANAYDDPRFNPIFDRASGFLTRSVITAPMRNPKGDVIGVVQVINKKEGLFSTNDEKTLLAMAAQAAISIEIARLHSQELNRKLLEQELQTAKKIQESLLPSRIMAHPHWQVGLFWQPANNVAGDFYTVLPLTTGNQPQQWLFSVADVSGKGVPAAIFMAVASTIMQSVTAVYPTPTEMLHSVNKALVSFNRDSRMFASIFLGYLNCEQGLFTCASAGHNPPLLCRAGRAEYMPIKGVIAGMFDSIPLEARQIQLGIGDVVVLYTDGITEATDEDNELYGEARLAELVSAYANESAQLITGKIVEAVGAWNGERGAFDDETVIVLKRVAG
jgi:isopentenyl phosphate kinase/serine phosphatase RsbU (regulator of sigma subunit)